MRSHGTIAHKEIEISDVWDFPAIENLKREKWCKKVEESFAKYAGTLISEVRIMKIN